MNTSFSSYRFVRLRTLLLVWLVCVCGMAEAQDWLENDNPGKLQLLDGLQYSAETQVSVSKGKTPLWLNANKQGLSSLESVNGYMRAAVMRPLQTDSARRWAVGYGLDVAVPLHYTSNVVVQQAFVEARWLYGSITVGAKENSLELKSNELSSGSQTLGINARPIPQVRVALDDYCCPPIFNGWLRLKGHVAYGKFTDNSFQRDFSSREQKYTTGTLFHSKAGYIKIGNEDRFLPVSLELGLEMAAQFGGTCYYPQADGTTLVTKGTNGLHGMWRAFLPGGGDVGETTYQNAEGNQLGSWVFRLNYDADVCTFSVYGDKYFEDHSAMFLLDYDGYGSGENWQSKEKRRYFLYDMKDMMLGMELKYKYVRPLSHIVLEYVYSKYQSGPIYHDHTAAIPDHIGGVDGYYNHFFYSGWQHWGQVVGNPLYRSALYNENHQLNTQSSRFMAFHLGIGGEPNERLFYRIKATWMESLGTYEKPFTKKQHDLSIMAEVGHYFRNGWKLKATAGMDAGKLLGHNYGCQLTLTKYGLLTSK